MRLISRLVYPCPARQLTPTQPDDLFAILCIVRQNEGARFSFVVGEGDAVIKALLLQRLLRAIGCQPLCVMQGLDSDTPYPVERLPAEWITPLGLPVPRPERLCNYRALYDKIDVCYLLKPPREALLLRLDAFKSVDCYAYGGFNYRVCPGAGPEGINKLASCFRAFHHASRFTDLATSGRYLARSLAHSQHPFALFARTMMTNWNEHYMVEHPGSHREDNPEIMFILADVLCVIQPRVWVEGMALVDYNKTREGGGVIIVSGDPPREREDAVRAEMDRVLGEFEAGSSL